MKSRKRHKKKVSFFSFFSHSVMLLIGCAAGIYVLPILTAPQTPTNKEFKIATNNAEYEAFFVKDLKGSNFLYWGKGELYLSKNMIAFQGKIAPGADYKMYLTKRFIQTGNEFLKIKDQSFLVDDVKSFDGFIIKTNKDLDLASYNSVVIWSEIFSIFITSAKYK